MNDLRELVQEAYDHLHARLLGNGAASLERAHDLLRRVLDDTWQFVPYPSEEEIAKLGGDDEIVDAVRVPDGWDHV